MNQSCSAQKVLSHPLGIACNFFAQCCYAWAIDYGDNDTLLHDQVIPRLRRFRPFARPSECSSARLRTDGAMERLGDKEAALRLGRGGRPVPLR